MREYKIPFATHSRAAAFVSPGQPASSFECLTQFTIVFRNCLEALHSKETFDGCPYREIPQANKVPMNQAEIIFSGAFVAAPRLLVLKQAHAQQEPKPGNAAAIFEWSECPMLWCELQRTPFRGRQLLNSITLPGCIDFWIQSLRGLLFSKLDSSQRVNQFGGATKLGHCLFRDCINLATFVLLEDSPDRATGMAGQIAKAFSSAYVLRHVVRRPGSFVSLRSDVQSRKARLAIMQQGRDNSKFRQCRTVHESFHSNGVH